jgi:hypothetical protein
MDRKPLDEEFERICRLAVVETEAQEEEEEEEAAALTLGWRRWWCRWRTAWV